MQTSEKAGDGVATYFGPSISETVSQQKPPPPEPWQISAETPETAQRHDPSQGNT
jgi:hypothetical protein